MISKSGNGGGTFAYSDITLEFVSWLSLEFKLYLITEFERLKRSESYQYKDYYQRLIDTIKRIIILKLTEKQKKIVYLEEAYVLNVALFGITAKEWQEQNITW